MWGTDGTVNNVLSYEMAVYLNMLRPHMERRITGDEGSILSQYICIGPSGGKPSSVRRERNHNISAVVSAMARYSASALERDTIDCF